MSIEGLLEDVIVLGVTMNVIEKTGLINSNTKKRRNKKKNQDNFLDW